MVVGSSTSQHCYPWPLNAVETSSVQIGIFFTFMSHKIWSASLSLWGSQAVSLHHLFPITHRYLISFLKSITLSSIGTALLSPLLCLHNQSYLSYWLCIYHILCSPRTHLYSQLAQFLLLYVWHAGSRLVLRVNCVYWTSVVQENLIPFMDTFCCSCDTSSLKGHNYHEWFA